MDTDPSVNDIDKTGDSQQALPDSQDKSKESFDAYLKRQVLAAYVALVVLLPIGYLFLIGKLIYGHTLFFYRSGRDLHWMDFMVEYMASCVFGKNGAHNIYNPEAQLAMV